MDEISVEIYYARFGVLVRPYVPTVGFDYNRVYYSLDSVIQDFEIHGWRFVKSEPNIEPKGGRFYTFRRLK